MPAARVIGASDNEVVSGGGGQKPILYSKIESVENWSEPNISSEASAG